MALACETSACCERICALTSPGSGRSGPSAGRSRLPAPFPQRRGASPDLPPRHKHASPPRSANSPICRCGKLSSESQVLDEPHAILSVAVVSGCCRDAIDFPVAPDPICWWNLTGPWFTGAVTARARPAPRARAAAKKCWQSCRPSPRPRSAGGCRRNGYRPGLGDLSPRAPVQVAA
jgi:hypothetical protein